MKLFALALCILCGCTVVHVKDEQRGLDFVARAPAWPWQDSLKSIEKVAVLAKTNGTASISLQGLNQSEITTQTNVDLWAAIAGAAASAAVRAAVGH